VARGAAQRRPRTSMVMSERSASSEAEEQPSILTQLRAWSAKHPLRPSDGSPPALCDPDEIQVAWVQSPNQRGRPPVVRNGRDASIEAAAADALVAALEQAVAAEDVDQISAARATMYAAALSFRRPMFGHVLEGMAAQGLAASGIRRIAHWLLGRAVHGEAIDLAICLVGATRARDGIDDLLLFGRHPAFWGLATWVLDRFGEDTTDLHWARAASVVGPTRQRILDRLSGRLAGRSDVRDWILRRGRSFDNVQNGSDGGLAAPCAIAGDLAGALADMDIDDDLLDIACSIVSRLLGHTWETRLKRIPRVSSPWIGSSVTCSIGATRSRG
jgi:hypothetical protein